MSCFVALSLLQGFVVVFPEENPSFPSGWGLRSGSVMLAGHGVVPRRAWVVSVHLHTSLTPLPLAGRVSSAALDAGAPGEGGHRAPRSLPAKLICLSIKDSVAWAGLRCQMESSVPSVPRRSSGYHMLCLGPCWALEGP